MMWVHFHCATPPWVNVFNNSFRSTNSTRGKLKEAQRVCTHLSIRSLPCVQGSTCLDILVISLLCCMHTISQALVSSPLHQCLCQSHTLFFHMVLGNDSWHTSYPKHDHFVNWILNYKSLWALGFSSTAVFIILSFQLVLPNLWKIPISKHFFHSPLLCTLSKFLSSRGELA